MSLKLGMLHRALRYFQVCSNDDPRLTFDLFMQLDETGSQVSDTGLLVIWLFKI